MLRNCLRFSPNVPRRPLLWLAGTVSVLLLTSASAVAGGYGD